MLGVKLVKPRSECYKSYLLGLLAKIKCSICSYQCENWYLLYGEAIFTSISYSGAQFKRLLCVPLRQSRLDLALLSRAARPTYPL